MANKFDADILKFTYSTCTGHSPQDEGSSEHSLHSGEGFCSLFRSPQEGNNTVLKVYGDGTRKYEEGISWSYPDPDPDP